MENPHPYTYDCNIYTILKSSKVNVLLPKCTNTIKHVYLFNFCNNIEHTPIVIHPVIHTSIYIRKYTISSEIQLDIIVGVAVLKIFTQQYIVNAHSLLCTLSNIHTNTSFLKKPNWLCCDPKKIKSPHSHAHTLFL